jgi:hypothetical protein
MGDIMAHFLDATGLTQVGKMFRQTSVGIGKFDGYAVNELVSV